MSGFGQFDMFSDSPDATEDPFGVAASARETQWWQPAATGSRKKKTVGFGFGGGAAAKQTPGSYFEPNLAAATPNPSDTQRVILGEKQKDEDAWKGAGFGQTSDSPSDSASFLDRFTGAATDAVNSGNQDAIPFVRSNYDLNGGGVRYPAPTLSDPTNPGQQDAARAASVDNPALQEYRDSIKKAKELEDLAMALPARTGITWGGAGTGSIEMKRNKYLADANIMRSRAAYAIAGQGGGASMRQDVKTVGNLVYDPNIQRADGGQGDYVYPDAAKAAAIHRVYGGASGAPHLETLIEPRTGKTVRVDLAAVPRNAQGALVSRKFERDDRLQGPSLPGAAMGDITELEYGVPAPASVQAKQLGIDNPKPEKAPKEPTVNPLAALQEKRKITAEAADKLNEITSPQLGTYWDNPKRAAEAKDAVAKIIRERDDALAAVDALRSGGGSGKGGPAAGSGGATPAMPQKWVDAIMASKEGTPFPSKYGTFAKKNGKIVKVN